MKNAIFWRKFYRLVSSEKTGNKMGKQAVNLHKKFAILPDLAYSSPRSFRV